MFTNSNTDRPSKVDMGQLLAVFGLMLLSVAFVFSATTSDESIGALAWYRQAWFRQIVWFVLGSGAAGGDLPDGLPHIDALVVRRLLAPPFSCWWQC